WWTHVGGWAQALVGAGRWWTQVGDWAQVLVGAGLSAKGPALLANLHPPFSVAAATVFAGKPAKRPSNPVQKNQIFSIYPLKAFPSAISFEYAMPKPGRVMTYLLNLRSL
ncbi:hypothetical protein ACF8SB_18865, partial [Pseudomonas sp. CJQ_8]